MNALGLQALVKPQMDNAFALAAQIVRTCIFYKTASNAGTGLLTLAALSAPVKAMVTLYTRRDIDGLNILFGDEKLIIRSGDLASIVNPGPGDYLLDLLAGIRWEIITSRLDPTGTFWIFQSRRTPNEDWGDFTPFTLSEDYGDLTAATLFDDWQN